MANRTKHMERSHRSHQNKVDFSEFERKAQLKKAKKENAGFFAKLFHRTTSK